MDGWMDGCFLAARRRLGAPWAGLEHLWSPRIMGKTCDSRQNALSHCSPRSAAEAAAFRYVCMDA
eukprot:1713456-Pyramimonas_sp.AAC.1